MSSKVTKGAKWDLFVFSLLLVAINIGGALCFLVGLLITVPMSAVSWAFVYRKLVARIEETEVSTEESKQGDREIKSQGPGSSNFQDRGQPSVPR